MQPLSAPGLWVVPVLVLLLGRVSATQPNDQGGEALLSVKDEGQTRDSVRARELIVRAPVLCLFQKLVDLPLVAVLWFQLPEQKRADGIRSSVLRKDRMKWCSAHRPRTDNWQLQPGTLFSVFSFSKEKTMSEASHLEGPLFDRALSCCSPSASAICSTTTSGDPLPRHCANYRSVYWPLWHHD